ncbi:hypothetical protein OW491_17435 [Neptunomonas sp. CHC150]|uniref:hypothetical protein n=1 Tax=Neptunomonas sp. CHC150 TaxID=2998324 RepID=UPI0025B048CF|nr:hypothetical protein [Neptunomonas sp. CHC150]MDN2661599.1 hypothetical protein [Neptunomonas sp. CHC150]
MKDYLEYKSEKNHLFFQIEVDGCSVVTLQGRVGEPAKKRVKTYKTNNGCYKYYHKMLFMMIDEGYRYLDNPNRPIGNIPVLDSNLIKDSIDDFEIADIANSDILFEENQIYAWVNKNSDNKLDWLFCFMIIDSVEKQSAYFSEVFPLYEYNEKITNKLTFKKDYCFEENKSKSAFIKGKKGFLPIRLSNISDILCGKNLGLLKDTPPIKTLIFQYVDPSRNSNKIVQIHSNHAFFWGENSLRICFYKDSIEFESDLINKLNKEYYFLSDKAPKISEDFLKETIASKLTIEKDIKKKKELLNCYPELEQHLSTGNGRKIFNRNFFSHMKTDLKENIMYVFPDNESIFVEGDLVASKVIYFSRVKRKTSLYNQIIITGNLIASNVIVDGSFSKIIVLGDVIIKNNFVSNGVFENSLCFDGICEVGVLIHDQRKLDKSRYDFNFEKQSSVYDQFIINDDFIEKNGDDKKFNADKLYVSFMKGDEVFTFEKSIPVDKKTIIIDSFISRMKNWGEYYCDLAGFEVLPIYEDNQIKEGRIYPDSGDWIVADRRCNSGTYGYSHDDASIKPVKIKHAKKYDINYRSKPIDRVVSTVDLASRFQWISDLFMARAHRKAVSVLAYFKNIEAISEAFEKEKIYFNEDHYLASYWLLHFGFSLDDRYHEVKKIIEVIPGLLSNEFISQAITFFDETDAFYNIKILKDEGDSDLFLIRRAHLVFITQSYKSTCENLKGWIDSIAIYPYAEPSLVNRIRWLKNNLEKYNKWNRFDEVFPNSLTNTPLISYIYACNPNVHDKDVYVNALINELLEYKDIWNGPDKLKFCQVLLWDVRCFVKEVNSYNLAVEYFFKSDRVSKEYIDINKSLGIDTNDFVVARGNVNKVNDLFSGYNSREVSADDKKIYRNKINGFLSSLKSRELYNLVDNIKNRELDIILFRYLWSNEILDKEDTLINLVLRLEFFDSDFNEEIFGENYPFIFKGESDKNLAIMKRILSFDVSAFRNDYAYDKTMRFVAKLFLTVSHLPEVFEFLISIIKEENDKINNAIVKEAVLTYVFAGEGCEEFRPLMKLSKQQVEHLLDAVSDSLLNTPYTPSAVRVLYSCNNPSAKSWFLSKHDNQEWLSQFSHLSDYGEPLDVKINKALADTLAYLP